MSNGKLEREKNVNKFITNYGNINYGILIPSMIGSFIFFYEFYLLLYSAFPHFELLETVKSLANNQTELFKYISANGLIIFSSITSKDFGLISSINSFIELLNTFKIELMGKIINIPPIPFGSIEIPAELKGYIGIKLELIIFALAILLTIKIIYSGIYFQAEQQLILHNSFCDTYYVPFIFLHKNINTFNKKKAYIRGLNGIKLDDLTNKQTKKLKALFFGIAANDLDNYEIIQNPKRIRAFHYIVLELEKKSIAPNIDKTKEYKNQHQKAENDTNNPRSRKNRRKNQTQ
jgi:hypothetical protein